MAVVCMKKPYKRLLMGLLLISFLVSSALLMGQFRDNAGGEEAYSEALALASGSGKTQKSTVSEKTVQKSETETAPAEPVWVPAPVTEEDPWMEEMAKIDLEALRQVNPDVIGWIRIPQSKINYPLLQGEDNDYYLNHAWDHRETSVGSIYLEHRSSADLTDYNTIVYGHNMNDGSMFAGLRNYATMGYWEKHPYVYLTTDDGVLRYEVFSSYKADIDSVTYGLSFQQKETKANFLINALEQTKLDTKIVPEENDRILTLSTCSGAGYTTRWVVHARLKMMLSEA